MTSNPTTGVCMFAYNTNQIDYTRLAVLAASCVKKHMKHNDVALITDYYTKQWLEHHFSKKIIQDLFDHIITTEQVNARKNIRTHYDSPWAKFQSEFKNTNKHEIFDLSPFDRTLLIDTDFIIQNNHLDCLFESNNAISLYKDAIMLDNQTMHEKELFLNPDGIRMIWSTVIYFDRLNQNTKPFFDLWAYIKENYNYYQFLYQFPSHLYRTDFCVSIAAHILGGYQKNDCPVSPILDAPMVYMSQKDDIVEYDQDKGWLFLVNDKQQNWKNILVRTRNENIHVTNKRALDRMFDQVMEST